MQRLLLIALALGATAAPALAQTAPAPQAAVPPTQAAQQPQFVEKVVCKDVDDDRVSGSRLAPTSRICRKIKVPVSGSAQRTPNQSDDASGE